LPVRRLGGMNGTVFAQTSEIEAWILCHGGDADGRTGTTVDVRVIKEIATPLPAGRYAITIRIDRGPEGPRACCLDISPTRENDGVDP
jgi:hypothetical protein